MEPHLHFLRALGWLKAAGLEQTAAHTYVADVPAPPTLELRDAVAYLLYMLWGNLEPHVSRDDWDTYQRICNEESEQFILNRPDYYGFLTYTLFSGRIT